jgi:hypothetical protein
MMKPKQNQSDTEMLEALAVIAHRHNVALVGLFIAILGHDTDDPSSTLETMLLGMAIPVPYERFCGGSSSLRKVIEQKKAALSSDEWEMQMAPFDSLEQILAQLRKRRELARQKAEVEQESLERKGKRPPQDAIEMQ